MNNDHKLSIEYLIECFELREDGTLIWKKRPESHFSCIAKAITTNKQRAGKIAGIIGKDNYVIVRIKRRLYPAHVIVYAIYNNKWPECEIDHKDRNRFNNYPDNLRSVSRNQNMANMNAHKDNKLGLKGVFEHKPGIFRAKIMRNGISVHLGLFKDPLSAHNAYKKAESELTDWRST